MKMPLLIDLDGVLRIKNIPAPGLSEFLSFIENSKTPACILSNSTLSTSKQVIQFFEKRNYRINIPIITAIDAASLYIKSKYSKVAAYTSENVIQLFNDKLDFENPEAVVIGDIGDKWNYKLMQTIFDYVRNGAELIAAHKNKYWDKPGLGIQLDAGPFIHGIEYASNSSATLIGKPSPLYFKMALEKLRFSENTKFTMIGDDVLSDMQGAKSVGAKTILIYTGKTPKPVEDIYKSFIDYEANNLLEVIEILKGEQDE